MGTLPTKTLLPRVSEHVDLAPVDVHSEGSRGSITDGETRAIVRDPVCVGDPDTCCRAVPCEDDVIVPIDVCQVGKFAEFGVLVRDLQELRV